MAKRSKKRFSRRRSPQESHALHQLHVLRKSMAKLKRKLEREKDPLKRERISAQIKELRVIMKQTNNLIRKW